MQHATCRRIVGDGLRVCWLNVLGFVTIPAVRERRNKHQTTIEANIDTANGNRPNRSDTCKVKYPLFRVGALACTDWHDALNSHFFPLKLSPNRISYSFHIGSLSRFLSFLPPYREAMARSMTVSYCGKLTNRLQTRGTHHMLFKFVRTKIWKAGMPVSIALFCSRYCCSCARPWSNDFKRPVLGMRGARE